MLQPNTDEQYEEDSVLNDVVHCQPRPQLKRRNSAQLVVTFSYPQYYTSRLLCSLEGHTYITTPLYECITIVTAKWGIMASPRQDLDSQKVPTSLLSSIRELSQHGIKAEKEKSNLKLPPLAVITASQVSSIS